MFSPLLVFLACGPSDYGFIIGSQDIEPERFDPSPDLPGPSLDSEPEPLESALRALPELGPEDKDEDLEVKVLQAWSHGTSGDDRPTAVATLDDGAILVGGTVGAGLPASATTGTQLMRYEPDGTLAWTTVFAPAAEGVTIHTIAPTADGGAWVCADVPAHVTLDSELGHVSQTWGESALMVHLDADGEVETVRSLGSIAGTAVVAGCGVDGAQHLVIDGTIEGGPMELALEYGRMMMPAVEDRGFVLVLAEDGSLVRLSTWDGTDTRRVASVVRQDGSVVQLFRYTGVPGMDHGTEHLPDCADGEQCHGLISIGSAGSVVWLGDLGSGVGPGPRLSASPTGDVVLAARLGDGGYLPRAPEEPAIGPAEETTVVARFAPDLSLRWVRSLSPEAVVESLTAGAEGQAVVGLWTGETDLLEVGDGELELPHDEGTMALAGFTFDGETSWMWAAGGSGDAWPTAVAVTEDETIVASVFADEVLMDEDEETECALDSEDGPDGSPTWDLGMTVLFTPRPPVE